MSYPYIKYPTIEEVEKADRFQLCKWYRFLKSPETEEQEKILTKIYIRWKKAGGFTPRISKQLGW